MKLPTQNMLFLILYTRSPLFFLELKNLEKPLSFTVYKLKNSQELIIKPQLLLSCFLEYYNYEKFETAS